MGSIRLERKVAIVTGATKGIGRSIVLGLASAGATIVGLARSSANVEELTAEVESRGGKFVFFRADVSQWGEVQNAAAYTLETFGRIDILINNAGTSLPQVRADKISEEDWRSVVSVTLEGTVFMTRAVLPAMIAQKDGVILNIASTAAVQTAATMSSYAAAKAAVTQYTKVVAVENVRNGVRANALLVGATDTDLVRQTLASHRKTAGGGDRAYNPDGASAEAGEDLLRDVMLMPPDGVAAAAVLLCAEEAREFTASEIMIDRANVAGLGHTHFIEWAACGALPRLAPA